MAFGAVSFSVVPTRAAVVFTLVLLLAAFLLTLVPLRAGKIGPTRISRGSAQ